MKTVNEQGQLMITPEELIEALESGRYKQGNSVLAHDGRHCCLGVALAECTDKPVPRGWKMLGDELRPAWMSRYLENELAYANDTGANPTPFAAPIRILRRLPR